MSMIGAILFGGTSGVQEEQYLYLAKRLYLFATLAVLLYVIIDSASVSSAALLWIVAIEPIVIRVGMDDKFTLSNSQIISLGVLAYIASQVLALPISYVYSTLRYVRMIVLFNMACLPIGYYFLFSPPLISVAITSAIFLLGTFVNRQLSLLFLIGIPVLAPIFLGLRAIRILGMRAIRLFVVRIVTFIAVYQTMRW